MRERKSTTARRPAAVAGRNSSGVAKHDYSKELMELVVEAANSRVLPEFLRSFAEYRMIIYSLLVIVLMIVRPQGLFSFQRKRN